jgi:hypothetical protein
MSLMRIGWGAQAKELSIMLRKRAIGLAATAIGLSGLMRLLQVRLRRLPRDTETSGNFLELLS